MFKKIWKRYGGDSFFLNLPLVVNTIIALVSLPIILKNLPLEHYGKWEFVIALQIWLVSFTGSRITTASKRGIVRGYGGTFLYGFLARLKLLFLVAFLVFIVAFLLQIQGDKILASLLIIQAFYLLFGYLFSVSLYEFFIAQKEFRKWCFWQIAIPFFSTLSSLIAVIYTKNIIYFAASGLGSAALFSIGIWLWTVKKEHLIPSYQKGKIEKKCVPYGLKLIPLDILSIIASKISHFLIGPFWGFSNLAIFSIASNLTERGAATIKTLPPLLYADFAKTKKEKLFRLVNNYLLRLGALGVIFTLLFIVGGFLYLKFFLTPFFSQTIIYFLILSLGLPAIILEVIFQTILEAHLRAQELLRIGIVSNLLKIGLILFLGYFWQIKGLCFALIIAHWATFGFYYFFTKRKEINVS